YAIDVLRSGWFVSSSIISPPLTPIYALSLHDALPICLTMAQLFHELSRCVTQVWGYGCAAMFSSKTSRLVVGHIPGITFSRYCQVDYSLTQGQLPLRRAQALIGLSSIIDYLQCARVCQTNVFPGHAHNTSR